MAFSPRLGLGLSRQPPTGGGGGGIPANALTLNGEPLTINGEILILGSAS